MHPLSAHRLSRRLCVAIVVALVAAQSFTAAAHAAGPPGPPTNLTAAAGDNVILLAWLPPTDDGGSPITSYYYEVRVSGVTVLTKDLETTATTILVSGPEHFVFYDTPVVIVIYAVNAFGYTPSEPSAEVTPREGATLPQTSIASIPASGGSTTTDSGGGPTLSDPIVTTVAVPATSGGGSVTIAETTPSEAPSGFVFLGQEIVIESTAATDAHNPLRIVFRVDASFVPVTIFRDGAPITDQCIPVGTANPSPCVESGAGTAEITILSDHASRWNVGFATYVFDGFFSPVDNRPVANGAKAGSVIPVRFGLGGDRGLNVFASNYPKSQQVTCDSGAAVDGIEETTRSDAATLTYSSGTGTYQYAWKTERSWAGTCRELIVRFRDGTEQRALFKLK